MMNKGLEIPFEVADGIVLAALLDQYRYLSEENRAHLEDGEWLHPEDLDKNLQLIGALKLLIGYYGGDV